MKKLNIITGLMLTFAGSVFGQTWSTNLGNLYNNPVTSNVGIGTASPVEKLHVLGGIRSYKDGSDGFSTQLYLSNSGNDKAFNFQLNSNSSSYPTSLNL